MVAAHSIESVGLGTLIVLLSVLHCTHVLNEWLGELLELVRAVNKVRAEWRSRRQSDAIQSPAVLPGPVPDAVEAPRPAPPSAGMPAGDGTDLSNVVRPLHPS